MGIETLFSGKPVAARIYCGSKLMAEQEAGATPKRQLT